MKPGAEETYESELGCLSVFWIRPVQDPLGYGPSDHSELNNVHSDQSESFYNAVSEPQQVSSQDFDNNSGESNSDSGFSDQAAQEEELAAEAPDEQVIFCQKSEVQF